MTVGFTLPVFTGGSRLSKVSERRAQVKQTEFNRQQLEDGIKLEIKSGYMNLKQEEEILKFQDENRAQAEEAAKLAEERYKNGLITNLEYMDTQVSLLQAKTEHLFSLSRYLIARARLIQLIGE